MLRFSLGSRFLGPWSLLLLSATLTVLGCTSKPPVGEVAGTVTFKGGPVGEGRITFQSNAGISDEALLEPDGTFTIKSLRTGEYQVTVEPLVVQGKPDPKGPVVGVEKPAPNIPQKYRTIGSTDLKATVTEGKNTLNFDMKP